MPSPTRTKQAIKKFDETTVRTNVNQIASTVWRIEKQQEDLKNWVLALGDLENYGAAIKQEQIRLSLLTRDREEEDPRPYSGLHCY